VAQRTLRQNHPKVLIRKYEQDGEVGNLPSGVVVVDSLMGSAEVKKLKRSCAYLLAVHDWQVIPAAFWTNNKKASRKVLEARHCMRRKAGKGGMLDIGGRPAHMLSQSSSQQAGYVRVEKVLKKKVRRR
jgi:hypothetical protein